MNMHSIAWWPILALLVMATAVDIRSRRIPNWLVLPFLAAGVVVNTASHGVKGLGQSLGGIALAVAVTGVLCWLRGMGMGDLKLCAAVGGWIGPGQLGAALYGTGGQKWQHEPVRDAPAMDIHRRSHHEQGEDRPPRDGVHVHRGPANESGWASARPLFSR